MWKRDDRRQSDLQDAVNRTRDELRRLAPEGAEPPPRTELPAPEADRAPVDAEVSTNHAPALADVATNHAVIDASILTNHAPALADVATNHAAIDASVSTDHAPAAGSARLGLHPFLQGLLEILPEPGADWPTVKREQWLETARNIFALIYDQNGALT